MPRQGVHHAKTYCSDVSITQEMLKIASKPLEARKKQGKNSL